MQLKNIMNKKIIFDPLTEQVIELAIREDIGIGDITTEAIFTDDIFAEGHFLVKEDGIIAGLDFVEKIFHNIDPSVEFKSNLVNGDKVSIGTIAAEVSGKAKSLLTSERTALNFMQRMSGIATSTASYIELIKHTNAKLLDTRKTVPGLRMIDKLAVLYGGGKNHRMGLFDMFLIKDNHIAIAGSISNAVMACKSFRIKNNIEAKIEVEVTSSAQIEETIEACADIIMLDNFDINEMKLAVTQINKRCLTEASGGVNLSTIKSIAETGVDFISVGAITHSVKALDISLELSIRKNN
jgi:nicotinate-nucleotide pyrophosphorylase (carboxylating)